MKPWLSDALLSSQTDERLVALTRAGHERAFAAIVDRYRRPLVGFARRITPDSRAEDVVQQALTSAWAALAAGAEVAHLRGWLHQIVRHEAIRTARQEGLAFADPLEEGTAAASAAAASGAIPSAAAARGRDAAAESEERERVRDALAGIAGLPAQQREALVQTTLAGRSRREVAAALGLSEGAVRQLVHRARTALRTAVTALTPLPLASWAAGLGGGAGPGIAELAAGAGGATLASTLLKTGAVVVAGGALATGATVSRERRAADPAPAQVREAGTAGGRGAGSPGGPAASALLAAPLGTSVFADDRVGEDDRGGGGGRGRGHGRGDDDRSSGRHGRGRDDRDRDGRGGGGHGRGGEGRDGRGSDDDRGRDGRGGDDDRDGRRNRGGGGHGGSGSGGSRGSGGGGSGRGGGSDDAARENRTSTGHGGGDRAPGGDDDRDGGSGSSGGAGGPVAAAPPAAAVAARVGAAPPVAVGAARPAVAAGPGRAAPPAAAGQAMTAGLAGAAPRAAMAAIPAGAAPPAEMTPTTTIADRSHTDMKTGLGSSTTLRPALICDWARWMWPRRAETADSASLNGYGRHAPCRFL